MPAEPVGATGASAVSDPTALTTDALRHEITQIRELVDAQLDVLRQRLDGIDKATSVFNETLTRVPTDVDKQVGHLKELTNERFDSVAQQFKERDTRSERESRDNKVAVDAAFAAQKEAASEQNKSNTLAIDKSEKATAETLNKQADLFKSTTDALSARLGSVESRMDRVEAAKLGSRETGLDSRAILASVVGVLLFLVAAGAVIVAVVKP